MRLVADIYIYIYCINSFVEILLNIVYYIRTLVSNLIPRAPLITANDASESIASARLNAISVFVVILLPCQWALSRLCAGLLAA